MRVRGLTDEDLPAVRVLNQQARPAVGDLDGERLRELLRMAAQALVADDGEVAGFVVAFGPGEPYDSINYRWFDDRYEHFCYIDRVVVAERARGRGVARRLYEHMSQTAAGRDAEVLTCEVNVRPPNPGSMAFHERLGFTEVGRQDTEAGAKRVVLLARPLPLVSGCAGGG